MYTIFQARRLFGARRFLRQRVMEMAPLTPMHDPLMMKSSWK
jgi:hypothetical protein